MSLQNLNTPQEELTQFLWRLWHNISTDWGGYMLFL